MNKKIKIISVAVVILVVFGFIASCGGNSVKKDLERFMNTDMTEVNQNYKAMKETVSKWSTFTTNEEFIKSITEEVLPNIEKSLALISGIEPKTDEVKALRDEYYAMLDTYKDGYEKMLYAFENENKVLANEGKYTISKAIDMLDKYNENLEALAKENDLKVNY